MTEGTDDQRKYQNYPDHSSVKIGRPEETCCHSYFREEPPVKTGDRNLPGGTFQNKERKFSRQLDEGYTRTNQQPDVKINKQFWVKTWEQKEDNRNTKWMNNTKRELQELQEYSGPAQRNTQENTKLENKSPWLHSWILVFKKIPVHPQQIDAETV